MSEFECKNSIWRPVEKIRVVGFAVKGGMEKAMRKTQTTPVKPNKLIGFALRSGHGRKGYEQKQKQKQLQEEQKHRFIGFVLKGGTEKAIRKTQPTPARPNKPTFALRGGHGKEGYERKENNCQKEQCMHRKH